MSMKLAEGILLSLGEASVNIKVKSDDKKGMVDKEVEVIKSSPKTGLVVVEVSPKKGTGRFGIYIKKAGKRVSPLYKAEEIVGNTYREKKLPVGDSIYHKFGSEAEAKKEAEELKKIFPSIEFFVEEDTIASTYSITHPPSGYAVLTTRIKSHALEALKLFEKNELVFIDSKDNKEVANAILSDKDKKEKLMSILKLYHNRSR
jgi:hypothetical protein